MKNKKKLTEPDSQSRHYFLIALLGVALFGCFKIIQPYLGPIILALIFAIVFHPIHARIEKKLKNRKSLTATISCVLLMTAFVMPLFMITAAAIQQGIESARSIIEWVNQGGIDILMQKPFVATLIEQFHERFIQFQKLFPDLKFQKMDIAAKMMGFSSWMLSFLTDQATIIIKNLTLMVGNFVLMLFVFFFLIKDYDSIVDGILHLSPLSTTQEQRILNRIKDVSSSALLGTLVTGVAQGAAGGFALWLCGLPGLFWGAVMAFASLIPIVGTALIWIPAALYLVIAGRLGAGLFIAIWCLVIVGMMDNVVRPLFMKGGADMSTALIFLSILGGINLFGIMGILYGPLLFGIALVLLYIYEAEYGEFLSHQDRN
ncbi:AI-2E family transporter [Desulforegula conservatrix]|uniref:AI-2E family transporter n=1 Tax=Desulforegula conservatrix TaxID=153026 RepID=UPI000402EAC7|nr:AI-2E family transporter [Desulforegula conservatrix]